MQLTQTAKYVLFGTAEHPHKLAKNFREADVDDAVDDLLVHYPDEAETIARYAERLKVMVR